MVFHFLYSSCPRRADALPAATYHPPGLESIPCLLAVFTLQYMLAIPLTHPLLHLTLRTTKSGHYPWPLNDESHFWNVRWMQSPKQVHGSSSTLRKLQVVITCQICSCWQVKLTQKKEKSHFGAHHRTQTSAWGCQQLFKASEAGTANFDNTHRAYTKEH